MLRISLFRFVLCSSRCVYKDHQRNHKHNHIRYIRAVTDTFINRIRTPLYERSHFEQVTAYLYGFVKILNTFVTVSGHLSFFIQKRFNEI